MYWENLRPDNLILFYFIFCRMKTDTAVRVTQQTKSMTHRMMSWCILGIRHSGWYEYFCLLYVYQMYDSSIPQSPHYRPTKPAILATGASVIAQEAARPTLDEQNISVDHTVIRDLVTPHISSPWPAFLTPVTRLDNRWYLDRPSKLRLLPAQGPRAPAELWSSSSSPHTLLESSDNDSEILVCAGLRHVLKRLSQAYGFTLEAIAEVYSELGSLRETEETLVAMKRAAEQVKYQCWQERQRQLHAVMMHELAISLRKREDSL